MAWNSLILDFWTIGFRLNRWLFVNISDAGKDWGQEEKGVTEDEMVEWHHRLNGHEFEQPLGDSEGQGNLPSYSPWGDGVQYDLAAEQQWGNVIPWNLSLIPITGSKNHTTFIEIPSHLSGECMLLGSLSRHSKDLEWRTLKLSARLGQTVS